MEQSPIQMPMPLLQGPLPSPILINSIVQGWGGNEPEPSPMIGSLPNQNLVPEPLQEPVHNLSTDFDDFSSDTESD